MHNSNPKRNSNRKIFYISLLSAAILLTVLGIIGVQKNTKAPERSLASNTAEENNKKTVNEDNASPSYPVLANNDTSIPQSSISADEESKARVKTEAAAETEKKQVAENSGNTENNQGSEDDCDTKNDIKKDDAGNSPKKEASETSSTPATSSAISATESPAPSVETAASSLHFDQEKGLLWPVIGDVILNYSMDQGVYFKTLGQYKCNPAILIQARKNTPVYAAADGIVEKVEKNDETGLTITCSAGDNFQIVYGQLKDVAVKEGDMIKEGQTLAKLAKPSNSYVLEENHLFFEVLEDGKPVDPMLLLR